LTNKLKNKLKINFIKKYFVNLPLKICFYERTTFLFKNIAIW
jgi:hypothetical protein